MHTEFGFRDLNLNFVKMYLTLDARHHIFTFGVILLPPSNFIFLYRLFAVIMGY